MDKNDAKYTLGKLLEKIQQRKNILMDICDDGIITVARYEDVFVRDKELDDLYNHADRITEVIRADSQ